MMAPHHWVENIKPTLKEPNLQSEHRYPQQCIVQISHDHQSSIKGEEKRNISLLMHRNG